MKMKKILSTLALTLVLTVTLTSCATNSVTTTTTTAPAATTKATVAATTAAEATTAAGVTTAVAAENPWAGKRIGVAHITLYDEWCAGVRDEFVAQAKALGFAECNVQDGDLNAETQQKIVENFITQKYDIIFIDPVSPEGIQPTLDKAKAAGIPVIAFDSSTPWPDLVSYIAWDHGQTGVLTGEYVAKYAKEKLGGKLNVGILAMLDAPHTAIRSEKFKETIIKELGEENINIVFEQDFGKTRDSAASIVSNNINKPIDIIWCAVDNAAFGAKVALEGKGVEGTKIVCAGAWGKEPFETLNAKDPYYMMCIGVSPTNIVKDSLAAACQYFAGDTANIPKRTDIELSVIDQSNVSEFMKFVQ